MTEVSADRDTRWNWAPHRGLPVDAFKISVLVLTSGGVAAVPQVSSSEGSIMRWNGDGARRSSNRSYARR